MPTIPIEQLTKISALYNQGQSVREIAEEFEVSVDAMFYFFRKHNILRRDASQRNKVFFQKKLASFSLKKNLSLEEERLKIAGIMLYWGEGSQWAGEKIVDFANSKPQMIKIFLCFLRDVCGIDESKLRIYLYAYQDQDLKEIMSFWSKLTGIPLKNFSKPYIRKDFKVEKSGKMEYGLIHIRYYDKKLLLLIKQWIEEYAQQY